MADREKVIKGLECCGDTMNCNECPYDSEMGGCFRNLKADALNLLKEQKSEEPLIIHKGKVDEVYDYIAKCPECSMTWAMWHSEKMRYCPGCGRAVKWDD